MTRTSLQKMTKGQEELLPERMQRDMELQEYLVNAHSMHVATNTIWASQNKNNIMAKKNIQTYLEFTKTCIQSPVCYRHSKIYNWCKTEIAYRIRVKHYDGRIYFAINNFRFLLDSWQISPFSPIQTQETKKWLLQRKTAGCYNHINREHFLQSQKPTTIKGCVDLHIHSICKHTSLNEPNSEKSLGKYRSPFSFLIHYLKIENELN